MTTNRGQRLSATSPSPLRRRSPVARVVAPLRRRLTAPAAGLRPRLPVGTFERRSAGAMAVLILIVLVTVGQLVRVQVIHAEDYAARGAVQRDTFLTIPGVRGRIYDRSGEVLATSVVSASVYADPRVFRPSQTPDGTPLPPAEDIDAAVAGLSDVLAMSPAEVRALLRTEGSFVWLARQRDAELGRAVRRLGIRGVGVRDEPRRAYPGGAIAAQVLGTTDIDGLGVAGMERQHDDLLVGQPGWVSYEAINRTGGAIPSGDRESQASVPGSDLVLTLDRHLQWTAEQVASRVVEQYDAAGASIVVLQVGTGDVLAMASAPTVDLTDRGAMADATLRNRPVTDMFEPGSVQKAITAAAAIEEGVVTPDTVFEVDDVIRVGRSTFSDSHAHPVEEMTFADIIEQSSNVGTIMVAQELGDEKLAEWLARFGYGQPLEVGFPGEAAGLVRPVDKWWESSLPTIAIGQGVAVTLLQAANAYATIANDGLAVQPRLVRGTVGRDGVLQPLPASHARSVVSVDTARQVREMLTRVVDGDRGTGAAAAVDGHLVAGKTGTARKARTDGRGYAGTYVATFVGMAPADDPEVVVAVMVDEPNVIWGGVVAAPVFSEVMGEALRRQHVASADEGPTLTAALRAADEAARRAEAARLAELEAARETAVTAGVTGAVDETTASPVAARRE